MEELEPKYWFILEPKHNPALNQVLALSQITGVFSTKIDAQKYLNANRGKYTHRATVIGLNDFTE